MGWVLLAKEMQVFQGTLFLLEALCRQVVWVGSGAPGGIQ